MASVAVEIVIIVALVLVNGLLAMSELALVSARRLRLKQRADQGDAGAAAALELAGEPNRFLSTAQIGITTVGIFAGAFGGATLAGKLAGYLQDQGLSQGVADGAAVAVVVLMITYLSLIIGELVPKRLALRNPERVASRVSRPMRLLSRLAAPVVAVLSVSTEAVLRVLRATSPPRSDITDEEIRLLLEQSTEAGIIDEAEEELAVAVFRLGDRDVADLLTPRREVIFLDVHSAPETVWNAVVQTPHTRFPVCEENLDNVIGVVALKDLVAQLARREEPNLLDILRPARFFPESLPALGALARFREVRESLAIVVDEHGGTSGVITLADVVGAIVGVVEEEGAGEQPVVRRADGTLLIDGALPVQDLKEELHLGALPDEGSYQTFAGFILHELGRIPSTGDTLEWDSWRFEVIDMDDRRIDKVLVSHRIPSPEPASE